MGFLFIVGVLAVFCLQLIYDWMIYKHRGRARPDPNDPNPPVIRTPGDAISHRIIDLSKEDKKK